MSEAFKQFLEVARSSIDLNEGVLHLDYVRSATGDYLHKDGVRSADDLTRCLPSVDMQDGVYMRVPASICVFRQGKDLRR